MQMKTETKMKVVLGLVVFCFFGFGFFALANEHLVSNPLTAETSGVRITDLAARVFGWLLIGSVVLAMLVEAWWGFQIRDRLGNARFVTVLLILVCFSIFGIFINYFFLLKPAASRA